MDKWDILITFRLKNEILSVPHIYYSLAQDFTREYQVDYNKLLASEI